MSKMTTKEATLILQLFVRSRLEGYTASVANGGRVNVEEERFIEALEVAIKALMHGDDRK